MGMIAAAKGINKAQRKSRSAIAKFAKRYSVPGVVASAAKKSKKKEPVKPTGPMTAKKESEAGASLLKKKKG